MKKTIALLLALVLCLGLTAALADTYGTAALTVVGTASDAKIVDGDAYDGKFQTNTTICFLVLDDAGIIKYVKFDVVQAPVTFTADGKCVTALNSEILSKEAKKDGYGMRKASSIGAEWFEQIAAFEAYCIGKTVEEVAAIPFYSISAGHDTCPDVEELKTTCTMTVGEYIEALKAAAEVAK